MGLLKTLEGQTLGRAVLEDQAEAGQGRTVAQMAEQGRLGRATTVGDLRMTAAAVAAVRVLLEVLGLQPIQEGLEEVV
jgi:hypothetical protein